MPLKSQFYESVLGVNNTLIKGELRHMSLAATYLPSFNSRLEIAIRINELKSDFKVLVSESCLRSTGLERRLEIRGELQVIRRKLNNLRGMYG